MNKHLLTGALLALATPFMASAACPAGKTGANVLDNQTRVISGTDFVGIITFLPGGTSTGVVTLAGGAYRQAAFSGRWMFDQNCENGMISILNGKFGGTRNFVNVNAAGVIGDSVIPGIYDSLRPPPDGPRPPASGVRGLVITFYGTPVTACPAFTLNNPLNALANTGWLYSATGEPSGAFVATLPNPNSGVLNIGRGLLAPNQVASLPGRPMPAQLLLRDDYVTQGRYTMNSNCNGGELLFMLNGQYRQFEFFFTDDKLNRMVFVSDAPNSNAIGSATLALVF
jgi:hypothetical protein